MLDIKIQGQLIAAQTASFESDEKNPDGSQKEIAYGKCQILQKDDNGFFSITNVKVSSDNFGYIPSWQSMIGKEVVMPLTQQTYTPRLANGGMGKTQINHYLAGPCPDAKKAA